VTDSQEVANVIEALRDRVEDLERALDEVQDVPEEMPQPQTPTLKSSFQTSIRSDKYLESSGGSPSGTDTDLNHSWLPLSPIGSVSMQVGDGKWSRRNTDLGYDGLTVLVPPGDGTFEIVAVLTADSDNKPFRDPSGIEVRFLASGETFVQKAHYMRRLLEVTWAGGVITNIIRRTLSDIVDTCDTINISESEGGDEWIATDTNPITQKTVKLVVETVEPVSGDSYEAAMLYQRPVSHHQGSTDLHKWDSGTEVFRFADCPDEESSG